MATGVIHPYLDLPGDGPDLEDRFLEWCEDNGCDPDEDCSAQAYHEWLVLDAKDGYGDWLADQAESDSYWGD